MTRYSAHLLCLAFVAHPAAADDWPRFLGPHGTGVSTETGLVTDWQTAAPVRRWNVPLHDDGYAGLSSADGMVFVVDHVGADDVVRALDLETGKERWKHTYAAPATDTWGASRATPTYDAGRLYTLSRTGLLHCLDARTGRVLWKQDLIQSYGGRLPFYRMVASPVVDGRLLIVCPGGASGVVALEKTTGALVWKSPNGEPEGHATPVVASLSGTKQYLVFTGQSLLGLSPADGKILWRFAWPTGEAMNTANPVVVGPDRVLLTSCDNGMALIRVDGSRATELWRNPAVRVYFGTPLVSDGLVFAKDDSQVLTCLDLATGRVLWRQPGFGAKWYDNGGLLVGRRLVVPHGRTGDLYVVAAERSGFRQIARLPSPAGRNCLVAPILTNGRLLVRSTSALVCLDLRPKPQQSAATHRAQQTAGSARTYQRSSRPLTVPSARRQGSPASSNVLRGSAPRP